MLIKVTCFIPHF